MGRLRPKPGCPEADQEVIKSPLISIAASKGAVAAHGSVGGVRDVQRATLGELEHAEPAVCALATMVVDHRACACC